MATAASIGSERGSWSVTGHSTFIEYSIPVLAQINLESIEGLKRFRRGGVEVGGVLFGVRKGEGVFIEAYRPLACEYALGPNFVLSDNDHAAFAELIESSKTNEQLSGLVPVGWYHSHTRTDIHLSERDLEIFERYFPEPWQIALVVRPEGFAPTMAGFFFREPDGSIHHESSHLELPGSCDLCGTAKAASSRTAGAGPASTRAEASVIAWISSSVSRKPAIEPPRARKWLPYALAALGVSLAGAYLAPVRKSPAPADQLSLTFEDRAGKLRISWDRNGTAVREAQSALLEIREGTRTKRVDLGIEELRNGSVLYPRMTDTVFVHMQAGTAEESSVFVGPIVSKPPGDKELKNEARSTQLELRQQADRIKRLEQMIETMNKKAKPKKELTTKPAKQRSSNPPAKGTPRSAIAPPPSPSVAQSPPPSALQPAVMTKPPARPHARTGTLIWTGQVKKGGTITIDGQRPSTGALTGEAPGFPVRVHVYPADLTRDGLEVYTAGPAGPVEPPGPRNGWNRTSYVVDPGRARLLAVIEPPSEENGWKRLVLRSDKPNLSVVLVKWDSL